MQILFTFFAVVSGAAALLYLAQYQFVLAFQIAFMSAAAFIGGRELKGAVTLGTLPQKIGRLLYAAILIAIAYYLARYVSFNKFELYKLQFPRIWWVIAGVAFGFLSDATRNPMRPPRKRG